MANQVTRYNRLGAAGRKNDQYQGQKSDPFIQTLVISAPLVASAAEQDTGITLPADCSIIDVVVNVKTASTGGTTQTIDVGVTGNPDQLIDGAATTATGFVGPTGGLGETTTIFNSATNITYALGAADITAFDGEIVVTYLASE